MFCAPKILLQNRNGHRLEIEFGVVDRELLEFENPGPAYWTSDGSYLYLSTHPTVDGCGLFYGYYDGLYRINLMTGELSTVLPALKFSEGFYDLSISPTGRRLAYVHYDAGNGPLVARIQDLRTGDIRSVDLAEDFSEAGGFVWSPDGTKLVIQMQRRREGDASNYYACPVSKTSILLVDLLNNSQEILFGNYPGDLRIQNWSQANVLEYYTSEDRLVRTYDLDAQQYGVVGTATPFP